MERAPEQLRSPAAIWEIPVPFPDKLEAVKGWPVPTNVKELQSFLGFMNYHRNHIQNCAQASAGLYALVQADSFYWRGKHQACFEKLK